MRYSRDVKSGKRDVRRKGLDERAGALIKGNLFDAGTAGHAFQTD